MPDLLIPDDMPGNRARRDETGHGLRHVVFFSLALVLVTVSLALLTA